MLSECGHTADLHIVIIKQQNVHNMHILSLLHSLKSTFDHF